MSSGPPLRPSRTHRRHRLGVLWITLLALGGAWPAWAADEIELRFVPNDPSAVGYRVYVAEPGASFMGPLDIGLQLADATGVASYRVPLLKVKALLGHAPTTSEIGVAMTAYNRYGESAFSNVVTKAVPLPAPPPTTNPPPQPPPPPPPPPPSGSGPPPAVAGLYYLEDFSGYAVGASPADWLDTGANHSLAPADLFRVHELIDGNRVLSTDSSADGIHSHFQGADPADLYSYEFTGRLGFDDAGSGIGVTIYSDYPNSDSYYALRRSGGGSFRLVTQPSANATCVGNTDTGVNPHAQTWYWFRLQAYDDAGGTRLRAKVWEEGTIEPGWQADCLDTAAVAYDHGLPGIWSSGPGRKGWDELEVIPLSPYYMDFDSAVAGGDPPFWLDTGANFSLAPADLFQVDRLIDGNQVLATTSTASNIHSHFMGADPADLYSYEFTGRLGFDDPESGIGVTIYSAYPTANAYYALRRSSGGSFRLSTQPGSSSTCVGTTDTGVNPRAHAWYWFRLQAYDESGGTRLRAKVWEEGEVEPDWQADCLDTDAGAYDHGVPGVWSSGPGKKGWDELEAIPLLVN